MATTETEKKENEFYSFPKLKLIEPEEYLKGQDSNNAINKLREINMKYVAMHNFLEKRKERTQHKIDELNESILTVKSIEKKQKMAKESEEGSKKAMELFMPLEESLYVKGEMHKSDTIFLWIGANVMVELKFDEALDLLTSHLGRAHTIYKQMVEEIEFMHKQVEIADTNLESVIHYLQNKQKNEKEKLTKEES